MWRIATRPYRGAHVAPFPLDLPLRAIAAGCPEGGLAMDPFCGAGTTGLAALQLGRRFAGIDVSAPFPRRDADPANPAPARPWAGGGVSLLTVPVSFRQAGQFVADWHRHHRPPRGLAGARIHLGRVLILLG